MLFNISNSGIGKEKERERTTGGSQDGNQVREYSGKVRDKLTLKDDLWREASALLRALSNLNSYSGM